MMLYFDTNIFIYLNKPSSSYFNDCSRLVAFCQQQHIPIATASETIQEVIHFAKYKRDLPRGLQLGKDILSITDRMYPVDKITTEIFLDQVKKYQLVESRDLIHVSVCLQNNIDTLITYDKALTRIKELAVLTPKQFLQ